MMVEAAEKGNDIIFTVSGCILDMHNIYLIPAKVWDTISELCDWHRNIKRETSESHT